jgi:hypothetical protein
MIHGQQNVKFKPVMFCKVLLLLLGFPQILLDHYSQHTTFETTYTMFQNNKQQLLACKFCLFLFSYSSVTLTARQYPGISNIFTVSLGHLDIWHLFLSPHNLYRTKWLGNSGITGSLRDICCFKRRHYRCSPNSYLLAPCPL